MAYSHSGVNVIKHSWGRFRATAGEDVTVGSLIDQDFKDAGAIAGENPALYIACEDIDSGSDGWFCTKAEVMKPSTVGSGGAVTRGNHGGTAGDVLFLSTTAGEAKEVPDGDGILQVVGRVLSQDTALLDPSPEYFEDMELVTANKTLDIQDVGKVMATATDAVVFTLPPTDVGLSLTIVNVGQDGDAKVSVSPAALDKIMGPDIAGVDDKDLINTKATARCMDRVTLLADGVDGWFVQDIKGTWAAEA
jgi:hypothetical protein